METETRRASELESAVRQGAGLYPEAVPIRRKKKEWRHMRTQPTNSIEKES
jgi:hypothetical protein